MNTTLTRGRAAATAGAVLILCLGCAPTSTPQTETKPRTVTVEHVIDGDTIIVDGDERVRFLGIDAPEVAHNEQPAEACADEATALVVDAIETGRTASIVTDESQPETDRYGRTLAYVEVDGTDLSAQLLEDGLADLYRAAPDISRYSHYQDLAQTAPTPACYG